MSPYLVTLNDVVQEFNDFTPKPQTEDAKHKSPNHVSPLFVSRHMWNPLGSDLTFAQLLSEDEAHGSRTDACLFCQLFASGAAVFVELHTDTYSRCWDGQALQLLPHPPNRKKRACATSALSHTTGNLIYKPSWNLINWRMSVLRELCCVHNSKVWNYQNVLQLHKYNSLK